IRFALAVAAAGTVLAATAGPAAAWPTPLTDVHHNFLNTVRGNFPGNDDQLLLAGNQACRGLYTGQPAAAVIDTTAATYGASPAQAATLVNAARANLCTQAPG